jgi:hypothetical protein
MFIDGEGFSGNGRLIDLDESVLGDNTTIGRDNSTFFNLNYITRNNFGGLDFSKSTVSKGNGFEGEGLF